MMTQPQLESDCILLEQIVRARHKAGEDNLETARRLVEAAARDLDFCTGSPLGVGAYLTALLTEARETSPAMVPLLEALAAELKIAA